MKRPPPAEALAACSGGFTPPLCSALAAEVANGVAGGRHRYGFKPACCDFFGSAILLQTNDFRVPSKRRF